MRASNKLSCIHLVLPLAPRDLRARDRILEMSKTPSYVLYERVRLGERLRITSIDAACGLLACATGTASVCVTARVVVHARVYS